jgi:hypothetical protein
MADDGLCESLHDCINCRPLNANVVLDALRDIHGAVARPLWSHKYREILGCDGRHRLAGQREVALVGHATQPQYDPKAPLVKVDTVSTNICEVHNSESYGSRYCGRRGDNNEEYDEPALIHPAALLTAMKRGAMAFRM